VITSTCALPCRASRLSRALASPVRNATVQSMPSSLAVCVNARVVSAASARSGVTHSTRGPSPVAAFARLISGVPSGVSSGVPS